MSSVNNYEIEIIKNAKKQLLCIPCAEQSKEYSAIILKMTHFLLQNCCHVIITDYIDINPDKSVAIYYCNICEESLPT